MEQQVGASIAAAAFAPESTVHVPLQLADVSEEQRLLEKFGLTDLTAKAIKTAQDFPDVQKKLKCIAGYKSGEHCQALFQRKVPGGPCHR